MAKFLQKDPSQGDNQRRKAGVSLQKFAGAKRSKFDKKAKAENKAAKNAKRINKYRKLTKRTPDNLPLPQTTEQKREGRPPQEDLDIQRVQSRAGPPPGKADNISQDSVGEASSREDADRVGTAEEADSADAQKKLFHEQDARQLLTEAGTGATKKRKKRQKPPSQLQRLAEKVQAEKEVKQKDRAQKAAENEEKQKKLQRSELGRKKQRELYFKKTKRGQPVMKHRIDTLLGKLQSEL